MEVIRRAVYIYLYIELCIHGPKAGVLDKVKVKVKFFFVLAARCTMRRKQAGEPA